MTDPAEREVALFPDPDVALTQIIVVSDVARSREFWTNVLGAELYREYGGTSVVLRFAGAWLLLVTGGEPTADKPGITLAPPTDPDTVSTSITLRVSDCWGAYRVLTGRGAQFLTPPHDWGAEIRCFLRDPDGHLIELSEARR